MNAQGDHRRDTSGVAQPGVQFSTLQNSAAPVPVPYVNTAHINASHTGKSDDLPSMSVSPC
jgi:hypothetical protein